jgi:hypothetical protein
MTSTMGRRLALLLGTAYLAFGLAEVVRHLGDPASGRIYWAITLLGGGALVLGGLQLTRRSPDAGRGCVTVGAAIGMVPAMWTYVVPVLAVAVIFYALQEPRPIPH